MSLRVRRSGNEERCREHHDHCGAGAGAKQKIWSACNQIVSGKPTPDLKVGLVAFRVDRAGWFRLRDGERALLYVTDPARVVYLPTADGYSVMLSVADPAAFIASLQRHAPAA